MKRYQIIAYGLLLLALLWFVPAGEAEAAGGVPLGARERSTSAAARQAARQKNKDDAEKKPNKKYQVLYEDDAYVYYIDMENVQWRKMPYTDKEMLDVWIRLIPRLEAPEAERMEAAGDLYMGHYYLEHYYLRRDTRQIQFLAELEVKGRPENDVDTGRYRSTAWEYLVPGSIEDSIYLHVMKRFNSPMGKMTSTSLTDFLEDVLRISL